MKREWPDGVYPQIFPRKNVMSAVTAVAPDSHAEQCCCHSCSLFVSEQRFSSRCHKTVKSLHCVGGGSNESNRRKPVNAQYTPLPGTKHRWINRPCFRFNKLNNIFRSTCCCYFSIVFCWEMGIGSFLGRLIHCLHSPHTHSPRSRSRTRILPFICAENIIIMLFWTARNGEKWRAADERKLNLLVLLTFIA